MIAPVFKISFYFLNPLHTTSRQDNHAFAACWHADFLRKNCRYPMETHVCAAAFFLPILLNISLIWDFLSLTMYQ